mmetsp:Transcript_5639/g.21230  ORF Transcript_5639/g.21230 Transcript_5639/m.21230 type:complete len:165 (+) Transcript_5639:1176-1670(+)
MLWCRRCVCANKDRVWLSQRTQPGTSLSVEAQKAIRTSVHESNSNIEYDGPQKLYRGSFCLMMLHAHCQSPHVERVQKRIGYDSWWDCLIAIFFDHNSVGNGQPHLSKSFRSTGEYALFASFMLRGTFVIFKSRKVFTLRATLLARWKRCFVSELCSIIFRISC